MQTLFTVNQASKVLGLTRERLYQLEKARLLEVTRGQLNRRQSRKLVSYDALMRYINGLESKAYRARARLNRAANGDLDLL